MIHVWRAVSVLLWMVACNNNKAEAFVSRHTLQASPIVLRHGAVESTNNEQQPALSLLWTVDQLEDYSAQTGVVISFTTFGPGYRAVARAKHDETLVLGYVEGFVRPTGRILHMDKMEVYQPMLEKAKRQVPDAFDFGGISFGISLLMGYRCLLHGTLRFALRCVRSFDGDWIHTSWIYSLPDILLTDNNTSIISFSARKELQGCGILVD
jgi:hypothetical protein